ncbi:hypothetical protein CPI83_30345 (plasmid) [Rhodococcus sp. H-CA8f]|nr:hypothetical protein CPI83_30345 [Rhodococcus sp. H-CA8f]
MLCVLAAVSVFIPVPGTTLIRVVAVVELAGVAVLLMWFRPTMLWRSHGDETAALHVNRLASGRRAVHGYTRWPVRTKAKTTAAATLASEVLEMAIATDTVLVTSFEVDELGVKYIEDYGFRTPSQEEEERFKVGGARGLIFDPAAIEPGFIDRLAVKIADRPM